MSETIHSIRNIVNIPSACRERYLKLDGTAARPLASMDIHYSGVSNLVPGYRIGVPAPASHMIIATVSGSGILRTPDQTWQLVPQTLLIAPPLSPWEYRVTGDEWHILWWHLRDLPAHAALRTKGIRRIDQRKTAPMERAMEGYLEESGDNGNQERALHYACLIASMLTEALEVNPVQSVDNARQHLELLITNVRNAPETAWSLTGLAQAMNVSVATLQRLAGRHLGKTIWQMILDIRMERAREILRNTDYPLKVVAARTGYADEFGFSSAFKRYYGKAPREFRIKNMAVKTMV